MQEEKIEVKMREETLEMIVMEMKMSVLRVKLDSKKMTIGETLVTLKEKKTVLVMALKWLRSKVNLSIERSCLKNRTECLRFLLLPFVDTHESDSS